MRVRQKRLRRVTSGLPLFMIFVDLFNLFMNVYNT